MAAGSIDRGASDRRDKWLILLAGTVLGATLSIAAWTVNETYNEGLRIANLEGQFNCVLKDDGKHHEHS